MKSPTMFLLSFALSCFLGMSFLFPSIEGVLFPYFDRPSVTTLKSIQQRSQTPPLTERNPNSPPLTSSTQNNSLEESPIFLPSSSISSTEETALEETSKNPSTLGKEPEISSTEQSFAFTTDSATTETTSEKSLSSEMNGSGKESGSTTDSPSTSIFIEPTPSSTEKGSVGDSDEREKITETSTEIVAKDESTTGVETKTQTETSTPESSNSKLMKEAALVLKTNVTQAESFSNETESVSRTNEYISETTTASQDVLHVTKPSTAEEKEKRQSSSLGTNSSSSEESVSTGEDNDDEDDNKEDSSPDLEEQSNTLVTPVTSLNEEHLTNKSEGNVTEEVTHSGKETSRTSVSTEEEKVDSDRKPDNVKNNVKDADEIVPSNQWSNNATKNNITKDSIPETTTAPNPSKNREGTSSRPDNHPGSSTKSPSSSTATPSTTLVVDITTSLPPAADTTTDINGQTQEMKCPAWHSFIPHKKTCEVTPLDSFRRFWSTITPRYGPHHFWSMFFGRSDR